MFSRVYVEITNICNKSCSFCPKTKRKLRQMSLDEFKKVADKIAPLTKYIYYHLMGEPLTHPLLCSFINYATSLGLKSAVTTNGSLLKEKGDELIKSGAYKINISLHSFESGTDKDFDNYIESCLDFADRASKSGILVVFRLWNKGADGTHNDKIENRIIEKFGPPEATSPRGMRLRDKLHLEYGDRFVWPDTSADDLGEDVFCYGLQDHIGILSDGSVVPCCLDHEGDITLGNAFYEDLVDILNGKRAEAMRAARKTKKASEELCRKCSYARRFKL